MNRIIITSINQKDRGNKMSNVSDIVLTSLLRAMSSANASTSSRTSSNDMFDSILGSMLGNLNFSSGTCESCRSNSMGNLDTLNTLLGTVNDNRINIKNSATNESSKTVVNESVENISKPAVEVPKLNDVNNSNKMNKAMEMLHAQLGKKYVWGATGPNSFDCSGLVQYVYKNALGKNIPRVSADQSKFGQAVGRKDLQVGDLLFFDTMNKGRVSHVGMYIGNNEFIHASNPRSGVKKSTLTGYYEKTYKGARRP